jgi:hypothetical protein
LVPWQTGDGCSLLSIYIEKESGATPPVANPGVRTALGFSMMTGDGVVLKEEDVCDVILFIIW